MDKLLELMQRHVKPSPKMIEELHRLAEEKTFPKKAEIRPVGYIWKELFFVFEGCVRHYYIKPDGEERTCDFSLEGQFFTDFQSLNQQSPSRYIYSAMEETRCLRLPYGELQDAYQKFPELERFGRLMAEQTANRISEMTHGLLMLSSEERYENLIENRPELFQRVPPKYIASYLGLKAESLSRIKRSILRNKEY